MLLTVHGKAYLVKIDGKMFLSLISVYVYSSFSSCTGKQTDRRILLVGGTLLDDKSTLLLSDKSHGCRNYKYGYFSWSHLL